MKRISLIDCPGVVQACNTDTETDIVLKGVIRIESLKQPEDHIPEVLSRVRDEYIRRTYGIQEWEDHIDFLTQLAKKSGKLHKGAEPDLHTVSKMVLHDFSRGKIPYFSPPPEVELPIEHSAPAKQAIPGVQQIFSKIRVESKFIQEDMKGAEPTEDDATETATQVEQVEETQECPDWDDIYKEVEADDITQVPAPIIEGEFDSDASATLVDDDLSSSEEVEKITQKQIVEEVEGRKKEPRMKTNNKKKAGVHYYETANVKNKNRSKTQQNKHEKLNDPKRLDRKMKGGGK
eukprot:Partr_v1_DN27524_c2_g1_i1_m30801 putative nucleolar gtp-binding protein